MMEALVSTPAWERTAGPEFDSAVCKNLSLPGVRIFAYLVSDVRVKTVLASFTSPLLGHQMVEASCRQSQL